MKLIPVVAYHFCLNFPGTYSQPRTSIIWEPSKRLSGRLDQQSADIPFYETFPAFSLCPHGEQDGLRAMHRAKTRQDTFSPSKGPFIKDVHTRRVDMGCPKADIYREVAWV